MAGDVVSASTGAMNSLLGKLATLMGEEYGKLKGVRKEIASLEDEFSSMKALLDKLADMDELDPQAKEWKNQTKDMSYDIEDCIDDFMHHMGKNDGNTGFFNKAARQLKNLRARHQVASKIQDIMVRVKEASERRTRYKLDEYTPNPSYVPVDPRVVAIHTEAANLVGMDIPKEELVEMVTGEEQVLKVVSVVGFGGLGKTTLANQVYRNLEGQFQCKAFVSVSQKPDMPRLLNKILLEVGGNVSHTAGLDDLENIKKHLQDKRYFIVIDDLWDSSVWKIIKCAFPENNRGSRILTTTRMSEVALACCSYSRKYVYHMRPLGEDNSKRLFFSRIFGSSQACPDAFKDSSDDIGILAGLPSLAHLQLHIKACPREMISIPNKTSMAFPALRLLTLTSPEPFLAFKSGALPRLQELQLVLDEVEWKDFGEWLDPVGMEHLPAGLKKILIYCFGVEFAGWPLFLDEATKSALRSRFTAHHPGVDLSFN